MVYAGFSCEPSPSSPGDTTYVKYLGIFPLVPYHFSMAVSVSASEPAGPAIHLLWIRAHLPRNDRESLPHLYFRHFHLANLTSIAVFFRLPYSFADSRREARRSGDRRFVVIVVRLEDHSNVIFIYFVENRTRHVATKRFFNLAIGPQLVQGLFDVSGVALSVSGSRLSRVYPTYSSFRGVGV